MEEPWQCWVWSAAGGGMWRPPVTKSVVELALGILLDLTVAEALSERQSYCFRAGIDSLR